MYIIGVHYWCTKCRFLHWGQNLMQINVGERMRFDVHWMHLMVNCNSIWCKIIALDQIDFTTKIASYLHCRCLLKWYLIKLKKKFYMKVKIHLSPLDFKLVYRTSYSWQLKRVFPMIIILNGSDRTKMMVTSGSGQTHDSPENTKGPIWANLTCTIQINQYKNRIKDFITSSCKVL